MAREKRGTGFRLVLLGEALISWIASAADPLAHQVEHPFRNVAAWLRKVSPDLKSTDIKTISRGITVLSNSQSYVKSFDGIAYELKGKLQESATTSDIDAIRKEAELYESKSSAKKASRLVKLLIEVEKALNSAEAAEIAAQFEGAVIAQYVRDAGLRFLPSPPPPSPLPIPENVIDSETVSETVRKTAKNPYASSVMDGRSRRSKSAVRAPTGTAQRSPPSKEVEFDGGDGTREDQQCTQTSQETEYQGGDPGPEEQKVGEKEGAKEENPLGAFVLTVAGGCEVQCLVMVDDRDERVVVAVGDALTGEALLASLFEEPAVVRLASYGLMRETAYVNRVAFQCACDILEWAGPAIKASLDSGPLEGYPVHCAGHSFGGAVAACLAGLLDGAIDVEAAETRGNGRDGAREDSEKKNVSRRKGKNSRDRRMHGLGTNEKSSTDEGIGRGGEDDAVDVDGAAPWVGICADRVTCVTLGCPPCLSPNLRLPFVTSFVLGDDMVPRTSQESLRRLKRRLLQVMPKGKGIVSQGMAFGTSLFTDVAGVAMQGVRQATTLDENDARLAVPGRVWFAKPRRLKGGATLSRVMNGNLREDMLWQLHDIMLTKSMLSHHRLDKYIKTLDRV